jgi:hypothetical protein
MKNNKNYIKILGQGLNLHENCVFNLNGSGLVLGVSLNIEKHLIPYLSANNVKQGEKRTVYFLEKQIESENVDVFYVQRVHDYLIKNAGANIRMAKSNYYKREANRMKNLIK